MKRVEYLVLGAGPAGLAFSRAIRAMGCEDFVVIEKDEVPGGLCRSVDTPWGKADPGGGHMWCTIHKEAHEFAMRHLPEEEWVSWDRVSSLVIRGSEIDYPVEENLWQLPPADAAEFLLDIMSRKPASDDNFKEWVFGQFGEKLASEYMIPYCEKLWGKPLDRMSLSWLHKLPSPDLKVVAMSFAKKRADKSKLFHRRWMYPKAGGFQTLYDMVASRVSDKIELNTPLSSLDVRSDGVVVNGKWIADVVVNTIPWSVVNDCGAMNPGAGLESVPLTVTLVKPEEGDYDGAPQWRYCPDLLTRHHRKFFSSRWMPGARFDFLETNTKRFESMPKEPSDLVSFDNQHAYPVYTKERDEALPRLFDWASKNRFLPLGRWGTWDYANSDVCIQKALEAVAGIKGVEVRAILDRL